MLNTDLIAGDVVLQVSKDINQETYFTICGQDVKLNSGYDIQDYLIETMTSDKYACYDYYESKLGNEFDVIWDPTKTVLQMIWRPERQRHKALTLYIPSSNEESPYVLGTLYYKTGMFD